MGDAGQIVIVGGGAVVVITAIIGLATFLLSNNTVAATHTEQIGDLKSEMATMKTEMALLRTEIAEQRTLKHAIRTEFTKTVMLLSLVEEADCTCGVLDPFRDIIHNVLSDAREQGVLDQPHFRREGDTQ